MNVKETIKNVKDNCKQNSCSRKDEISVMNAMMNDPSYTVDVYDKTGKCGEFQPGKEFRAVVTNAVANITKMPKSEATELVNQYQFSNADAASMVGFSKEFVGSYLQTGRKMSLGGRVDSNVQLQWRAISERPTFDIKDRTKQTGVTPAHSGIKVSNPCPSWVK